MKSNDETKTFAELSDEFEEALTWIAGMGFNLAPTRLGKYRKLLATLVADHRDGKFDQLKAEQDRHLENLFEVKEILHVYRGLKDGPVEGLTKKIKEIRGGPITRIEERHGGASGRSRNTMFELSTAAHLKRLGCAVDLSKVSDITAILDANKIVVECKRPQSKDMVVKDLNEGLSQGKRRIALDFIPSAFSIVAIDLSKVDNLEAARFVGRDAASIHRGLVAHIDRRLPDLVPTSKLHANSRCLGVFFRMAMIAEATVASIPIFALEWAFVKNSRLSTTHRDIGDRLETRMLQFMAEMEFE